jgi:hypothetical protein
MTGQNISAIGSASQPSINTVKKTDEKTGEDYSFLSVLANYFTDFLKGKKGEKKVKIEIVVENGKTHKKITYEGDGKGLAELVEIVVENGNGKTYKKVTYEGDGKGITELVEIVKNV